jgi:uncharacterized protein YtpQ (UPF0354 family)
MFRLVACGFALLVFAVTARPAAAETLTPRAFTEAFAAAATAAMPTAKITVAGDLHVETRSARRETTTTDLNNAYQGDTTHLDTLIRRYVSVLIDAVRVGDAKRPPDRSRIVPVLKPARWVEAVQKQREAAPATQLLTEPFNNELTIVYAEDLPTSVRYLMNSDDVGDRGKLRRLALENLHRLLAKIEMLAGAEGVFLVSAGGDYDASLLLADSIWSSGQIKVDGDIVAAVPSKGTLLVTGSLNAAGVARLHALAAKIATGPYALTPSLFIYRDGKWETLSDR